MESLQAALRECQEAGERVEQTLTERLRQATGAMAGAQVVGGGGESGADPHRAAETGYSSHGRSTGSRRRGREWS